jgi:hypothetical protein
MSRTVPEPALDAEADRLRADVDSGRTGDKVEWPIRRQRLLELMTKPLALIPVAGPRACRRETNRRPRSQRQRGNAGKFLLALTLALAVAVLVWGLS